MKVRIVTISMLIISGYMYAGLMQTIAEAPGKAIEATVTVAKDVVTVPAKVVGAVKEEERMEQVAPIKETAQHEEQPTEQTGLLIDAIDDADGGIDLNDHDNRSDDIHESLEINV